MNNFRAYCFFAVGGVEAGAKKDLSIKSREKPLCKKHEHLSTDARNTAVEAGAKKDLPYYFSTLSTAMKSTPVESLDYSNSLNYNDLQTFPQLPRLPQEKNAKPATSQTSDPKNLIFDWLSIVVEEGHIEPSQPTVGKIIGWPSREFSDESLFIDFFVWCLKQKINQWYVPTRELFHSVLSKVFIKTNNNYGFPPLLECQSKFISLRKEYEPSSVSE